MRDKYMSDILDYLLIQKSFDFSGYRTKMLERRIQKRIFNTNSTGQEAYLEYLKDHPEELDQLIQTLTIKVSSFFRDSLAFELIKKQVIPYIVDDKLRAGEKSLRIWSAGCSCGEEPYSMAILLSEYIQKMQVSLDFKFFATDLDKKAIESAIYGIYRYESLKETKIDIVKRYFDEIDGKFLLDPSIRKMVKFSFLDLLAKKPTTPPESIYGGFDVILCRNVLIYFKKEQQEMIFSKLYNSLNQNGILILGESEVPNLSIERKFIRLNRFSKIYRKL